jgi:hypothetical protein
MNTAKEKRRTGHRITLTGFQATLLRSAPE